MSAKRIIHSPPAIRAMPTLELLSAAEEQELLEGLRDAGHEVIPIGDARRLLDRIAYWRDSCDLVFNRSVGYRGTERKGIVPAILEAAGIPYVGSTSYVLSLTRNKYHTKRIIQDIGILTPPATLLFGGIDERLEAVRYPAMVKPVAESSSIGIETGASIVATPDAARMRAQILYARYGQPVLVESFVEGIEIEAPILVDPTAARARIDGDYYRRPAAGGNPLSRLGFGI